MRPASLALGGLLLLNLMLPTASQPAPAAGTPLAGARRALLSLKEDRLEDFAAAMHPEALSSFRTMLLQVVDGAVKEGKQAEVLPLFEGVADVDGLKKLSESQFYVAFLRRVMTPDLKSTLAGANYRFLGHVMEGQTAHVVYRMALPTGGRTVVIPAVISLKKRGAEWGALLTGEVEGMAQILMERFAGAKAEKVLGALKTEPRVIGHVLEGKEAAHLVVRWITTGGPGRVTRLAAHTVRPKDAGWKLLMKGDRRALELHLKKNAAPL